MRLHERKRHIEENKQLLINVYDAMITPKTMNNLDRLDVLEILSNHFGFDASDIMTEYTKKLKNNKGF